MRSIGIFVFALSFLALAGLGAPCTAIAGGPLPSLFSSPNSNAFQSPGVGVASTVTTISVILNPNGQTVEAGRIQALSLAGPNAADFAIVPGGTCVPGTTVLFPSTPTTGTSCTVTVKYIPSTTAVENALINVTCQATAITGGFTVTCTAGGTSGTVSSLQGTVLAVFTAIPTLNPAATTALAMLLLLLGMFVALRRTPRR